MNVTMGVEETYLEAARLNREDPLRSGSLLLFPDYGQLVMTGDFHGHRRNFAKLKRFCDLVKFGARHVFLHELIHEEIETGTARDTSYELLLEAARWKCEFPDQVHFLLSNHELAQVSGNEITKNGHVVTKVFEQSVRSAYGPDGAAILDAMSQFFRSLPLAGRTVNRVFLSHSLPGPKEVSSFDPSVLTREATEKDLGDRGSARAMVWGRYHTRAALEKLMELLDVDFFICGHQPQELGFDVLHDRMIILASEHNHGVFLPFDLKKPVTLECLTKKIRPFAGVM